jgi:hypothetical protein
MSDPTQIGGAPNPLPTQIPPSNQSPLQSAPTAIPPSTPVSNNTQSTGYASVEPMVMPANIQPSTSTVTPVTIPAPVSTPAEHLHQFVTQHAEQVLPQSAISLPVQNIPVLEQVQNIPLAPVTIAATPADNTILPNANQIPVQQAITLEAQTQPFIQQTPPTEQQIPTPIQQTAQQQPPPSIVQQVSTQPHEPVPLPIQQVQQVYQQPQMPPQQNIPPQPNIQQSQNTPPMPKVTTPHKKHSKVLNIILITGGLLVAIVGALIIPISGVTLASTLADNAGNHSLAAMIDMQINGKGKTAFSFASIDASKPETCNKLYDDIKKSKLNATEIKGNIAANIDIANTKGSILKIGFDGKGAANSKGGSGDISLNASLDVDRIKNLVGEYFATNKKIQDALKNVNLGKVVATMSAAGVADDNIYNYTVPGLTISANNIKYNDSIDTVYGGKSDEVTQNKDTKPTEEVLKKATAIQSKWSNLSPSDVFSDTTGYAAAQEICSAFNKIIIGNYGEYDLPSGKKAKGRLITLDLKENLPENIGTKFSDAYYSDTKFTDFLKNEFENFKYIAEHPESGIISTSLFFRINADDLKNNAVTKEEWDLYVNKLRTKPVTDNSTNNLLNIDTSYIAKFFKGGLIRKSLYVNRSGEVTGLDISSSVSLKQEFIDVFALFDKSQELSTMKLIGSIEASDITNKVSDSDISKTKTEYVETSRFADEFSNRAASVKFKSDIEKPLKNITDAITAIVESIFGSSSLSTTTPANP